jgi:hypothetical protein
MNSTGYGGEGAHRGFNDASVTLVSSALHGPLHVGGGGHGRISIVRYFDYKMISSDNP